MSARVTLPADTKNRFRGWRAARLLTVVAVGLVAASPARAIVMVCYNILNYSGGRTTEFKTIMNALQPDVLVSQEVISLGGAQAFRDTVLNAVDGPGGYTLCDFRDGADTDNALFIRSASITGGDVANHTWMTTSPRITDRWKLGLVGYTAEASKFYVYSMHTKAGNTAQDQTDRANQCAVVRTNGNQLPANTNLMYCGDMNLYTSAETAYQNLTGSAADNDGRTFDPINTPGTWTNNFTFRAIHTQSPIDNNTNGAPPGYTGGGMDDRFDFILISAALNDNEGLAYVPGTYKAYGNDSNHFNLDINDAPTIPEGITIANALHGAADHVPVVMTIQVPAKVSADAGLAFGRLITGASPSMNLTVTNVAAAPADELTYTLAAPTGYSADPGPHNDPAGMSGNVHAVSVTETAVGALNGTLFVYSDDVDASTTSVALTATIVRHAVPSLTTPSQTLSDSVDFGMHSPGGFSAQPVDVHNLGFDSLQALLEVYNFTITGDPQNRYSLPGFANPSVGASPASISVAFDESGLAPFTPYAATLKLHTRDEQIAGAVNQSDLTISLTAEALPSKGDLNLSGVVEGGDVPLFVNVLLGLDGDALRVNLADMNNSGTPDADDIPQFINAL